jgi:hypothetical protein
MSKWVSDCIAEHTVHCKTSDLENRLPARVIQVFEPEDHERVLAPRLVLTAEKKGTYAILSHCWGPDSSKTTRTLLENADDHYKQLDIEKISANFRDAIKIAHGMKIPYLWIDSLCIIQNSRKDWETESSKMAQYYQNAKVTISGLASPSADYGILGLRRHDAKIARLDTPKGDVFVRLQLEDTVSVISDNVWSSTRPNVNYMPLNERAWTLQERVLSSRILHFSGEQMVWQCRTCAISEDGKYTWNRRPEQSAKAGIVDILRLGQVNDQKKQPMSVMKTGWYDLLHEYTRRKMTYGSDKLPGIAGLVHVVAGLTNGTYRAGLWLGPFRDDLLWERSETYMSVFPSPYKRLSNGSPTWSWASLDGPIANNVAGNRRVPSEHDPKLKRIATNMATKDAFSAVRSGRVEVMATFHEYSGPLTFRKSATPVVGNDAQESGVEDDVDANTTDGEYEDELFETFVLDIPCSRYDFDTSRHYLLFFGEYNSDMGSKDPQWADPKNKYSSQLFLLVKESNGESNTAERVGIAHGNNGKRFKLTDANGWKRQLFVLV